MEEEEEKIEEEENMEEGKMIGSECPEYHPARSYCTCKALYLQPQYANHNTLRCHTRAHLMQFMRITITTLTSPSPVGSEWLMLYADLANLPGYL